MHDVNMYACMYAGDQGRLAFDVATNKAAKGKGSKKGDKQNRKKKTRAVEAT